MACFLGISGKSTGNLASYCAFPVQICSRKFIPFCGDMTATEALPSCFNASCQVHFERKYHFSSIFSCSPHFIYEVSMGPLIITPNYIFASCFILLLKLVPKQAGIGVSAENLSSKEVGDAENGGGAKRTHGLPEFPFKKYIQAY